MPEAEKSAPSRPEGPTPYVTSAVGIGETAGRTRARRISLFTQTVLWVTGLVCLAFFLGSLAQAWSNNQLLQALQQEKQHTQQLERQHLQLTQQAGYYQQPYVIEDEARERLGYARSGEHVLIVTQATPQATLYTKAKPGSTASGGFWQQWWNFFLGKH